MTAGPGRSVLTAFRVLLLFFSSTLYAQQHYPLNDPRNPDCPCHQAQQQAEQEFAQLNRLPVNAVKNDAIENAEKNVTEARAVSAATTAAPAAGRGVRGKKRRRRIVLLQSLQFRYLRGQKGLHRLHGNNAACFHKW